MVLATALVLALASAALLAVVLPLLDDMFAGAYKKFIAPQVPRRTFVDWWRGLPGSFKPEAIRATSIPLAEYLLLLALVAVCAGGFFLVSLYVITPALTTLEEICCAIGWTPPPLPHWIQESRVVEPTLVLTTIVGAVLFALFLVIRDGGPRKD
jgi:hypothetical protein